MPTPIYSARLFTVDAAGGGITNIPVPPGVVWVIRNVQITTFITSNAAAALDLILDSLTWLHLAIPPLQTRTSQWSGRMVAPGGSTLQVSMGGTLADSAHIIASGYVLT